MKKILWIGLLGILATAGAAQAAEVKVDFTFSPEDVSLTSAGAYAAIDLADGSRVVDEVGAPSIPAKFVNVLLPAGAQNVKISASGAGTLLAEGITPYPAQPRSPKSKARPAFVPANDRYASAAAWPADAAVYQGDHEMQGYRFVSVRLNPLTYVGAEQALYLRKQITVTATYDLAVAARTISSRQANLFGPLVNSLVVNPLAAAGFAPQVRTSEPKAALDYLIITSATLSNAFQQVADYRASAAGGGYTTRVATTNVIGTLYSGDIQARIRSYISNSVETLGTTMVLLGGDDTIVPVRYTSVSVESGDTSETNMPTDLYYSGLNGSWNGDGDAKYGETNDAVDMAWDVVVARLPVRTETQASNYLNKVATYEAGKPVTNKIILGGPNAWNTYTGTSRPNDDVTGDGHAGFRATSPMNHKTVSDSEQWLRRLYRDGIRSNWPATVGLMCDTITSWDTTTNCGSWVQSEANTKTAFNKNWTHLMFSGHGAPQEWGLESGSFLDTDASSMTGLTAFVYTDACLTGHFDKNSNSIDGYSYTTEPCLAESFLRNANVLGGAVAYMGCARFGWGEPDESPAEDDSNGGTSTVYAYKFYKRMYETSGRTLGTAFAMHKADMVSLCSSNEAERWVQFGLNLLGDPALKMPAWTDTPVAPAFVSGVSFGATANVATAFSVSASGSPAPTLALRSTTASGGYVFTAGSGVLSYTPPEADIGSPTFTFTASNSMGVATQTVAATVVAGPPSAPASIWASATNNADFTAAWSAVGTATGYRLDVATSASFSEGGAAGVLLDEGFDNGTTAPAGWTFAFINGTYTTAGNYGTAAPSLKMTNTGASVQTPALSNPTNVSFWVKGQTATGSSLLLEAASGGSWSTVTNVTTLPTTGTTYSSPLGTSVTNLRFTYTKSAGNLSFDDVRVTGSGGGGSTGFVAGYSNRTVAGTSQSVTGLTVGATYYFRACAVNTSGTGSYSAVATVTTLDLPSAPSFAAIPGQSATVGALFTLDVSGYASGSPAPALSLQSTTASSGYSFAGTTLSFTPSATGTFAFVFRASNTLGIAGATANVAVAESSDLVAPVIQAASGIQAQQFNANWLAAANATGYRLDVATNSAFRHTMGKRTATLAAGDLVIVTVNSDTNGTGKGFDAVPLVDLDAGTVIYFTDNGWSNGNWRANEGIVTYTAPGAITAGTVLSYRSVTANGFTSNANFNLATGGDTILAYQGPTNSPTFLFGVGWAMGTPWIESGSVSANNSMIPAGLSAGTYTIVSCGTSDNYQYAAANGTTGSKGSLLQWVANAGNWTSDDTTPFAKFTPDFTVGVVEQYNDFVPGYENRDVGSATTCVVTGLTEGVTYYYRAKAYNASSNSPYSGTTSVVTAASSTPDPEPIVIGHGPGGGAAMSLQIASMVGVTYRLEYTTNLLAQPPAWWPAATTNGTGAAVTLEDDDPADGSRYYRIVKP